MTILNPIVWSWQQLKTASHAVGSTKPDEYWGDAKRSSYIPVATIETEDLRIALKRGLADFGALRTDLVFFAILYPVIGFFLARFAAGAGLFPLIFPLLSGFALIGPVAALGFFELSRSREQGLETQWTYVFGVLRSPAIGSIALLSLLMLELFALWLLTAEAIFNATLGPQAPASLGSFLYDTVTTQRGWTMMILGDAAGFLYALVALAIGAVSFPLLLDRNVGIDAAIRTSVRAIAANPVTMAKWGLIVTAGLVLGALPMLLGLIVVLPVLGHATWHLYRRLVVR